MAKKKRKRKSTNIADNHSAHFKIKEHRLTELHRLRPVKDFHINGWINPNKYSILKESLEADLSSNKGIYPKDQAITVWKARDPEDRRRVVYNIEDGYRRYLVAKDLGLEDVYVRIIDETSIE